MADNSTGGGSTHYTNAEEPVVSPDGGPAFPNANRLNGMSLRDWFAGQVLAGMMANTGDEDLTPKLTARFTYVLADAMLAERDKEPE